MNEFKRGDYVHCPHHGYYGIVTRPFDMLITWEGRTERSVTTAKTT